MSDMMTQEEAMNMSNEQAVQILITMRNMMCDQNGCPISDAVFALDKAIEALSADRPTWIPCSERLPETEISVLIWLPSHWNKNGGTVEIGFLDEDNGWNWLAESMSGYYEIVEGVSAWMPLPEPYREEDDR